MSERKPLTPSDSDEPEAALDPDDLEALDDPEAALDDPDEPVAVLEIEDSIDLHGFRPRDILNVVDDYLDEAIARGFREVRLIHGRGVGVQRARIQDLLRADPRVERFADAPATRGGWGATVVWLHPNAARRSSP